MATELTYTVIPEFKPEVDVTVEMDRPMPTEPLEQADWCAERDDKVREALDAKAEELEMDGYLAEWVATEGGNWTIKGEA